MKTIIKNGIVVTSTDTYKADLLIEKGIIKRISDQILPETDEKVIDASGQYIFPGGIDVHTHLAWPFQSTGTADDFVSGTRAAAAGGITSIINFTNPKRGQTLLDNLQEWKKKGEPSLIDYGFHSIISEYNDHVLEELPLLAEQEGVTSIKLFMAYKGELMVNDREMYKIMKKAGEAGIITNVHAENGDIIDELIAEAISKGNTDPIHHAYTRPPLTEAEATARALAIAEAANAPIYIVHVSCADALEKIEQAKKRDVQVVAETCPHYLVLDESYLSLPDFESGKYICSPPLREKWNQEYLWKGISSGLITTVGSDHCPFLFNGQKTLGRDNFAKIPNGVPGLEDIFSIVYHFGVHEGRISLQKFVDVISTGPAKTFGLYPKKGSIAIGFDADLVIFNPNTSRVITHKKQYQNVDYNLYEGIEVQGAITQVLSRGEVIVQDGYVVGHEGRGQYLFRKKIPAGQSSVSC
ncbi:dihydropyrimidinase [Neobacillus kokaensis]|uniref:Dihydropyrimidinase n=1 Tax=Neobacillus kokaensis TaxID=2759023 RepID=A0ABQ3N653_9BACI|nr:dihydropyrimidinase [Neobacillus kokaensis]GHH98973.1 dihydropyrimidinase [Neobacillus kokaensis]